MTIGPIVKAVAKEVGKSVLESAVNTVKKEAKEVGKGFAESAINVAKKEAADLPEKIGEILQTKILPEKIESVHNELGKIRDAGENQYPSTYKERIDRTPSEQSERGNWEGERGESQYYPSDGDMKQLLEQYELTGIEYQNGMPDFSKCAASTVEIEDMTDIRYKNFAQCDEKCAQTWSKEFRDQKGDWSARDVQRWREEKGFSWHERNDMKTCDLVPTKINDYFSHLGGVSECKKYNSAYGFGGDFDE